MDAVQREARAVLGDQADRLISLLRGKSPAEAATILNIPEQWPRLGEQFEPFLQEQLNSVARIGIDAAAGRLAAQDYAFNLPFEAAADWAREQAANLVRGVEETTRQIIRDKTTAAIERGVDPLKFEQEMIDALSDMPAWRARRIADTEVMTAYSQGKVARFRESGVVWGKRWRAAPSGACKICQALNGQIVAMGQPFDAGGRAIPEGMQAHPHCRCTVQPVTYREAAALGLAPIAPEVVRG